MDFNDKVFILDVVPYLQASFYKSLEFCRKGIHI